MGNMSYCRFTNTLIDLRDCYEHMDDEVNPQAEENARKQLIKLCKDIAFEHEDDD